RRIGRKLIGFDQSGIDDDAHARGEILAHVEPQDLFEFGMIPEFVGRLPITATLAQLSKDDLIRVMTEPRNAIVRQYRKLFEMTGAVLEFAPEALGAIADR